MSKRQMTDAEIEAAAASDPDNPPLSAAQLARMRRVPFAKFTRRKLGLSQEVFAERFGIPLGTLRDWEQGRRDPDQAARALLQVIAAEPDTVRRVLNDAMIAERFGDRLEKHSPAGASAGEAKAVAGSALSHHRRVPARAAAKRKTPN